jgi:hypothetical protein
MEVSCELQALAVFSPGKQPQYTLNKMVGGLQSQPGRFWIKTSCPRPESKPDHAVVQHVANHYTD